MKKTHELLVLCLFFMCSCLNRQENLNRKFGVENEDSVVRISKQLDIIDSSMTISVPQFNPNVAHVLLLEDIIDTLYFVKLETDEDFIVGKIKKMEIVNDTIFILDSYSTKTVFTFGMNGKKISKIGQVGNGPGEYNEPTSMSVNENCIFIYDQWQQKVIKYDHSGKVISDKRVPFFCQKVFPLDNNEMFCFGAGMDNLHLPKILNYCFWQCDSAYKKITKVGLFSENSKTIVNGNIPLEHYNGNYFYFHDKTNDFYKITPEGEIIHLAHVKFNPEYPEEFYTNIDYRLDKLRNNNALAVTRFFKTRNHIIYELCGDGYPCFFFQNIKDSTIKFVNITNDIKSNLSRVLHMGRPLYVYGDWIVFAYSPELLLNKIKIYESKTDNLWSDAPNHVREFDKKLLESLHDEDNDILIFAKIKEHFD